MPFEQGSAACGAEETTVYVKGFMSSGAFFCAALRCSRRGQCARHNPHGQTLPGPSCIFVRWLCGAHFCTASALRCAESDHLCACRRDRGRLQRLGDITRPPLPARTPFIFSRYCWILDHNPPGHRRVPDSTLYGLAAHMAGSQRRTATNGSRKVEATHAFSTQSLPSRPALPRLRWLACG